MKTFMNFHGLLGCLRVPGFLSCFVRPPLSATNTWDSSWWRRHLVESWIAPGFLRTPNPRSIYGFSACWCRLRKFYIVYVSVHVNAHGCKYIYIKLYIKYHMYIVYIPYIYICIYIYLDFCLCPWSCGCCRAKLSISHIQCPRQWQWHLLVSPSATTWRSVTAATWHIKKKKQPMRIGEHDVWIGTFRLIYIQLSCIIIRYQITL